MRALLISANTERINMPTFPLGLVLVGAAAREAGHEVELLDMMAAADTVPVLEQSITSFRPQVIGVSVRLEFLMMFFVLLVSWWLDLFCKGRPI
jgi:hypothetical protein